MARVSSEESHGLEIGPHAVHAPCRNPATYTTSGTSCSLCGQLVRREPAVSYFIGNKGCSSENPLS